MSNPSITGDALDVPPVPPAPKVSWWEDYVDIFYAPASVFARRIDSGFFVPLLVVTVLIGLIGLANAGVMQPIMDAEFTRSTAAAMRKNPQITADMMEKGRGIGEKIVKIGGFIFPPIGILCTGLFLWIVGKFVDAKQTLGAAMMVTAYSYVVKVIEGISGGVQGLVLDPATLNGRLRISLGVGRFLDPDTASPVLLAMVGRIDVFTIWLTILLAIGLSVTGKIPRSKAAVAAVILWVLGALPSVLGALRQ
ncbi:MAG: YIP1 family protein [bacterium]